MKTTVKTLFFASAFFFLGSIAYAQSTPKVKDRQVNQVSRIGNGIADGSLTKYEAKKLKQDQVELQRMKVAAKSDGVVTRRERIALDRKQDKNSRAIYRQKNDRQKRY